VLSQLTGIPPKMRSSAYYSKQLRPAQRNYDVGDREYLAVKKDPSGTAAHFVHQLW
jgi:hypothetical protein